MGNSFRLEEAVIPLLEYILPLRDMYHQYCRGKIAGKTPDQAGRIAWAWLAVNCEPDITDDPRIIRLGPVSSPLNTRNVLGTGSVYLDLLDMGFLNDVLMPSFTELFWSHVIFASDTDQILGIAARDVQVRDKVTWKPDPSPHPVIYRQIEHGGMLWQKHIAIQVNVVARAACDSWKVETIDQMLKDKVQDAAAVISDAVRDHGIRKTVRGIPRMLGNRPALPLQHTF